MEMKNFKVTFFRGKYELAAIEVYAEDWASLEEFIKQFYPDTNFDYEEVK